MSANPHSPLSDRWWEWTIREAIQEIVSTERERQPIAAQRQQTSATLTAFGETKTVCAWLRDPRCQVGDGTLRRRIKYGWDPERALTQPPNAASSAASRRRKSLREAA